MPHVTLDPATIAFAAAAAVAVVLLAAIALLAALMAAATITELTVHWRTARSGVRHLRALWSLPAIPDAARNTHRTAEEA